jgi:subtilase family serine protease
MTLTDLSVSSLQANKSKKFNASIIVPAGIEGGEYRLVAKVDSSNDVIEWIEVNNTAISECFEIVDEL